MSSLSWLDIDVASDRIAPTLAFAASSCATVVAFFTLSWFALALGPWHVAQNVPYFT